MNGKTVTLCIMVNEWLKMVEITSGYDPETRPCGAIFFGGCRTGGGGALIGMGHLSGTGYIHRSVGIQVLQGRSRECPNTCLTGVRWARQGEEAPSPPP